MSLSIFVYPKGPLDENTYLIVDEQDNKFIIDPGYYGEDIVSQIGKENTLKYIILTHAHFDHFNSINKFLNKYCEASFVASLNEKRLIEKYNCPKPNKYVTENDKILFGSRKIEFIETPGHTEGGVCVMIDNNVFSGDTLFYHSVGNTNFETGDFDTLINSIKNKLFILNGDTIVYPGHGNKTTINEEKRLNPFV